MKNISLLTLVSTTFLVFGIFLGSAYSTYVQQDRLKQKLSDCTNGIDKINWESFLKVEYYFDKKGLILAYKNNSNCFNFEKVTSRILTYKNGVTDTSSITLKEIIHANKKVTINIQDLDVDSIKILQSEINQKSLNF